MLSRRNIHMRVLSYLKIDENMQKKLSLNSKFIKSHTIELLTIMYLVEEIFSRARKIKENFFDKKRAKLLVIDKK